MSESNPLLVQWSSLIFLASTYPTYAYEYTEHNRHLKWQPTSDHLPASKWISIPSFMAI